MWLGGVYVIAVRARSWSVWSMGVQQEEVEEEDCMGGGGSHGGRQNTVGAGTKGPRHPQKCSQACHVVSGALKVQDPNITQYISPTLLLSHFYRGIKHLLAF